MYELTQVGTNSYYVNCPAKMGLYVSGGDAWLIDSGNDKDAGKKARRILDEHGWTLRAILNTHSHADHIGGNKYLQDQTGCAVYAPGVERDFTRHTVLEPAALYGGFPPKELRHKFLMAQPSDAMELTEAVLPAGMKMLSLPGHSFDMAGFLTADGVAYIGDCVSGAETLEKYGIGYLYDVAAHLDTLERVAAMEAAMFVPAHAPATEDIAPLARLNIEKVRETAETILSFCAEPVHFEALLRDVFRHYGLTMTMEQYALIGSTVRSYLSWLKDTGRVTAAIDDNMLLWQRV